MKAFLLVFGCLLFLPSRAQETDSLNFYYQMGIEAYKRGDHTAFLKAMQLAEGLRSNHPAITYNLASAYSLTGQPEPAIKYLRKYVLMNSLTDISKEEDFMAIKELKEFREIIKLSENLKDSIKESKVAFTLKTSDFHAESMTYHLTGKTFYFGGVHHRGIIKIKGKKEEIWLDDRDEEDLYAVMGMEIGLSGKTLWVCTAALPEMKGYHEDLDGKSSVIEFDLKTKAIVTKVVVNQGNLFGDLTMNKLGEVFISDGRQNYIYKIQSGDTAVQRFSDLSKVTRNLQGIACSPDQTSLYVSDYVNGILKLNLESRQSSWLEFPDDIPFKGIDGLYCHGNTLIAIQNGTRPKRVLQLTLSPPGERVQAYNVLEQATERLSEPTQGVIIGTRFYYIANSPWDNYPESHQWKDDHEKPLVILNGSIQ